MKHGIFYAFWEHEWEADYCYYIKKAAKLGFDILEIGAFALIGQPKEKVRDIRKCAEDNHIILTGGGGPTPDNNIASADPAVAAHALDTYARLFEQLGEVDAHTMCGGLYSYWPYNFSNLDVKEEEWKRSVAGMRKAADLAAPYGINLCMEVLNRFEGYLINTAEECVRYCEDVGKDNVKVHLDTFHMGIEEDDMGDAIRTAGSRLGHLHTGEANRRVPGQGNRVPWKDIGQALHDIGYDGNVVMEPFVMMGGAVGHDISIWHDRSKGATEEQLDRDAAEALKFQKAMLEI